MSIRLRPFFQGLGLMSLVALLGCQPSATSQPVVAVTTTAVSAPPVVAQQATAPVAAVPPSVVTPAAPAAGPKTSPPTGAIVVNQPAEGLVPTPKTTPPANNPSENKRMNLVQALASLAQIEGAGDPLGDGIEGFDVEEQSEAWNRIKANNLEALRQANRQPRIENCKSPDVLIIEVDDLGYGDLGVYGQDRIKTPHMDRLANEGVRFTEYYAGTGTGNPSRCAMMTGFHTGHCRIRGNTPESALAAQDCTIADVMWQGGYDTALVGRWSLGQPQTTGAPTKNGFEQAFGYMSRSEVANHFPPFLWRNNEKQILPGNSDGGKEMLSHKLFTDEAITYIKQKRRRPYFLYLSLTMPHADLSQLDDVTPYTSESWPMAQKRYAAAITQVDASVGKIMETIEKIREEQGDNARGTIVILTSDNGPHTDGVNPEFFTSAGQFRGQKGALYEGGIRVPMIVWGKNIIPQGRVSNHVWASWDLLPTIAELTASNRLPRGIDGISQAPLFKGDALFQPNEHLQHDYLYWELHEGGFQQAIRQGKWKAIRDSADGPVKLYNLESDKSESNDVASDHPDVATKLASLMNKARTDSPQWPVAAE